MSKHHAPPPDHSHPYKVADHLFISGHPDHARDFLEKGVDAVIDLEGDVDSSIPEKESQEKTTIYVYWPIKDENKMPDEDSVRSLSVFVAKLIDEGKEVLVHCKAGHNRSGMVCARTLIEKGASPEEAIKAVRDGRGDGKALRNQTFVDWLMKEGA